MLRRALGSQIGKDEDWQLEQRAGHVLISRVEPGVPRSGVRLLERRGRSCLFVHTAKAKELRFAIGDEVECNMGHLPNGMTNWQKGCITGLNPTMNAVYLCTLDNGQQGITAPHDFDSTIRAAGATLKKTKKAGGGWSGGGGFSSGFGGVGGFGKSNDVRGERTAKRDQGPRLSEEIALKKVAAAGQLDELTGREAELQNLLDVVESSVVTRLRSWQEAAVEANDLPAALKFAAHRALLAASVLRGAMARVSHDEKEAVNKNEEAAAKKAERSRGATRPAKEY